MLKRTSLKRGSSSLKKKSSKYLEGKEERIKRGKLMMELFTLHWNTHKDKKCESCGKQLYGENNTMYHEHILEKSKYPELALNIDNLALVCPKCHTNKHAGIINEQYQEIINRAREQFL